MKKKEQYTIVEIPAEKVFRPQFRARVEFRREELDELMQDIQKNGLLQPLVVRPVRGGYEVVAGDRRNEALNRLGFKTKPCIVLDKTYAETELCKYSENKIRSDLSDIEEARQLKYLLEVHKCTEKELAMKISKSVSYVKQKLQILEYPDYLYNALAERLISFSAARELMRISDEKTRKEYVSFAVRNGISPRIAKEWADDWLERNRYETEESEEGNEEVGGSVVREPQFMCELCGRERKVSETRLMRVCIDEDD